MFVAILVASGYDPSLIRSMPSTTIRQLGMISTARLSAAVVISASAGIAVWQSIAMQTLLALLWSSLATIGTFILLLSMYRLSACIGGPGIIREDVETAAWRPLRYRIALMLFVGTVAAQPLIMIAQKASIDTLVSSRIDELTVVQVTQQNNVLNAGDSALRLERAELAERLALLRVIDTDGAINQSTVLPAIAAMPSRKALLIGVQNYPQAPLNNPIRDVVQMAEKLDAMGFTVTTSVDDPGDVIVGKLGRFFADLRPGDISLVYYTGHGFQRDGHNYLVPVDFDYDANFNAIRVTRFLEAADRSSPQLQVVILDACREFFSNGLTLSTGGLAELQGGNNSFIAMAAKPGELALDGPPGTSGVFTGAILRHIDRPEDINTIFRRISADVAQEAEKQNFIQQPVITSTLTREYVQLVDPQIARPAALFEPPKITIDDPDVSETTVTKEVDIHCPPPPGADLQFQKSMVSDCLERRIAAIDRVLADWQMAGRNLLQNSAPAYRNALLTSGLFNEKLKIIWTITPVMAAAVTTIIALLLAAGEFLNFSYGDAVSKYVRHRNKQARDKLKEGYLETVEVTESQLRNLRHPDYAPLEKFRTSFAWYGPEVTTANWALGSHWATEFERDAIENWLSARKTVATHEGV